MVPCRSADLLVEDANKRRSSMRKAISTVECERRYNRRLPDPVTAGLLRERIPVSSSTSNIEPLARDICERDLRRAGIPQASLSAEIDRYWHCVAAHIEAGLMDDDNELIPHDLDTGLAAYRDWRARHPDYKIPPMRQPSDAPAS